MAYIYAQVKESLANEAKRFECISKRYQLPYCIMLVWFEGEEDVSDIIVANTRCADKFVKIEEHLYGLIFFANRPDAHTKVTNKILYILEKQYPSHKISIGVACSDSDEIQDVTARAVQNLLSAKEQDYNTIVDTF